MSPVCRIVTNWERSLVEKSFANDDVSKSLSRIMVYSFGHQRIHFTRTTDLKYDKTFVELFQKYKITRYLRISNVDLVERHQNFWKQNSFIFFEIEFEIEILRSRF